jgi:uncharacterized membrane protein
MILHLPPGSSALARAAGEALLITHIGAGCLGVASGAIAFLARKGERAHRVAGTVFFVSMLTMAAIGGIVSPFLPQRANVGPAILTFYLTATGWLTIRRTGGRAGRLDVAALALALAGVAVGVMFAAWAARNPDGRLDGDPPAVFLVFAALTALAAALDVSVILRGQITGAARLGRHLWRMGAALLIASASLFLGQPRVFPAPLRGSPIMAAPEIAILGLMIFWLARVGLSARARPRAPTRRSNRTAILASQPARETP